MWDRLHADLLRLLRQAGKLDANLAVIDGVYVRAFGGGEATGPSPVDRGKPGTKHTLLVKDHFDVVAENIKHDFQAAFHDKLEQHEDRLVRVERKTGIAA